MTSHDFATRLAQIQPHISTDQAWLVTNSNDIQYLTGFVSLVPEEREALLVLTSTQAHLLYASFSPVTKIAGVSYHPGVYAQKIKNHLETIRQATPFTTLALDERFLYLEEYRVFEAFAQANSVTLTALKTQPLEQLRMVKQPSELELLRQAGQVAAQAWAELEPWLKPGVTERQVKQKLEQLLLEFGSQRPAFPTIVAFGPHSALPHHQPTETVLTENTAVLIDFGATIGEYRSDMTRTIWIGTQPDPLFEKIKTTVVEAYDQTIAFLNQTLNTTTTSNPTSNPSATPSQPVQALEIDTIARNIIRQAGYENEFIHTTGHGIGLDIHEPPSLSWSNTGHIKHGFVITVEPGIYLEGKFGFRYENTVAYLPPAVEILTQEA